MVLHLIISTVADTVKVLHALDTRDAAIDYIKTIATKWVCDNVGINNFVDTLEADTLPQRAGFYIQYSDKNTRSEITASQVIATPVSGWTGTYHTYSTKPICKWSIIETDANIVLRETRDKLIRDVDSIVADYRTAEEEHRVVVTGLEQRLDITTNNLKQQLDANGELERQLTAALETITQLNAKIRELSINKSYKLYDPKPCTSKATPAASYDDVISELKNRLTHIAHRHVVAASAPPPPPTKPLPIKPLPVVEMKDVDLSDYHDDADGDDSDTEVSARLPPLMVKSLDDLLDDLDHDISVGKW